MPIVVVLICATLVLGICSLSVLASTDTSQRAIYSVAYSGVQSLASIIFGVLSHL